MSKILFLGRLREQAGMEEIEIDLASVSSLSALISAIARGDDGLAKALSAPSVRVIVNKSVHVESQKLPPHIDEIAFLPPLSGG